MKWFLVGGCCGVFLLTGCLDEGLSQIVKRDSNDVQAEVVYPSGPLTQQDIREVQRLLNARGYDAGPADGIMGPRTRSAITAFQRDSGMAVDGEPSWPLLVNLGGTPPAQVATSRTTGEPLTIPLPTNMHPTERQVYNLCADRVNAQRRRLNQPEVALRYGGAAGGAGEAVEMAGAALGLAQDLGLARGGLRGLQQSQRMYEAQQTLAVGAAVAGHATGGPGLNPAQQAALAEIEQCVARELQAGSRGMFQ